ncbi:MAG: glycosyl hydrolase family 18 protein [Deltaproteobacteria bacterium]
MPIIHTVQPGESLWEISREHNIPYESIAQANGINPPYNLVPGENLYIPSVQKRHIVRPGESLWSISQLYDVSIDTLMDVNKIGPSQIIYPGQVLIIPAESNTLGTIEVNGYLEPYGPTGQELKIINDVNDYLTYLSLFSYRIQEDGTIIPLKNDKVLVDAARRGGVAPLMVLTNFRGGTFDTELADAILKNPQLQEALINNVIRTLQEKNFFGLNVDFERVSPSSRDLYTEFLKKLRDRLHPLGYSLSVALAPKQSASQIGAWYEAHDYGAIGSIADFVILMTYEWGWSGGPPLAVAPIDQVKKVLNYAVTVIPRKKIMMGIPLYGYDWTLPYIPKGGFARRLSPVQAVERAVRYGSKIQFDSESQSPYYYYYDGNGNRHVVWFEDAKSVLAKFKLVKDYGLRGVSYWVLGSDFPQNWLLLEDLFNIKKVL